MSAAKRSKRSQKYTKRKISLFLRNVIVITAISIASPPPPPGEIHLNGTTQGGELRLNTERLEQMLPNDQYGLVPKGGFSYRVPRG